MNIAAKEFETAIASRRYYLQFENVLEKTEFGWTKRKSVFGRQTLMMTSCKQ